MTLDETRPRLLDEHSEKSRCPYCHDGVETSEALERDVECARCGARHHVECFGENGGCSIMGCGGAQAFAPGREIAIEASALARASGVQAPPRDHVRAMADPRAAAAVRGALVTAALLGIASVGLILAHDSGHVRFSLGAIAGLGLLAVGWVFLVRHAGRLRAAARARPEAPETRPCEHCGAPVELARDTCPRCRAAVSP